MHDVLSSVIENNGFGQTIMYDKLKDIASKYEIDPVVLDSELTYILTGIKRDG